MDSERTPAVPWWKRPWVLAIAGTLAVAAVAAALIAARLEPIVKDRIVSLLRDRYECDVSVGRVHLTLLPQLRMQLENVELRQQNRDAGPLISIRRLTADAGWFSLFEKPARVRQATLEGLRIRTPRKHNGPAEPKPTGDQRPQRHSPFLVEQIVADGTVLEVLPKREDKDSLTFEIQKLTLHSVGLDRPMNFVATLVNPKPPGLIRTTGQFGPWQSEEAGDTPVSGSYEFRNADLAAFKGIAGILSSDGKYRGELDNIAVDGTTDVPDFRLDSSGHPVRLTTRFHAVVDGTNGDTLLDPVEAHFRNSTIIAQGNVAKQPGDQGKTVSLDGTAQDARLEDLLWLVAKADRPAMRGVTSFHSKIVVPPVPEPVMDKLLLDGEFRVASATFGKGEVQNRIMKLSERARGDTEDDPESVVANLQGRFVMRNGAITFSRLSFSVPGALVRLSGTYGVRSQELDFHGALEMQATVSETTKGVKSFLLKAVDPLFHKHGAGAYVPIKITGDREHPSFALDIGKVFK